MYGHSFLISSLVTNQNFVSPIVKCCALTQDLQLLLLNESVAVISGAFLTGNSEHHCQLSYN